LPSKNEVHPELPCANSAPTQVVGVRPVNCI
jgi:hypothetical protein